MNIATQRLILDLSAVPFMMLMVCTFADILGHLSVLCGW